MSRNAVRYKCKGNLLGYKINTTGKQFPREIQRALADSRKNIIKDLRAMFRKRIKDRIPKLRSQLINGFRGGNFEGVNLEKTIGTAEFESTPGHHSPHKHKVHKDIPDIWSRVIKQGLLVKVVNNGKSSVVVELSFSKARKSYIKYHNKTKTPPQVEKLVERFEETCLGFIGSGNFGNTVEQWGRYNSIGLYSDIRKYVKNMKSVRK